MRIFKYLATSIFALVLLTGCDEGPAESAGESIDETVEDTGEGLEEAGEETEDALN